MTPLTSSELRDMIGKQANNVHRLSSSQSKELLLKAAQRLIEFIEELPEI